jgi:hypothetical protein
MTNDPFGMDDAFRFGINAPQRAAGLTRDCILTAIRRTEKLWGKLMEFAVLNVEEAVAYANELAAARSPERLVAVTTDYGARQFAALSGQTAQLAAMAYGLAPDSPR